MAKLQQDYFKSINEFYNFTLTNKPNLVFEGRNMSSQKTDGKKWTGTETYEEAINLLIHGWSEKAKDLEKALQLRTKNLASLMKVKTEYSMVGGQVSVPRYLQGIPTSMINKRPAPQKQKVVTLTKSISYHCGVSTDQIFDFSLAALQMVKAIEESGTRVNLNIVLGTIANYQEVQVKIRIKSASERLNISKLAFPLTHPSMLRRMLFKYIEVNPKITDNNFRSGYGSPTEDKNIVLEKDEILIPRIFKESDIENFIKNNLK